ncbi:MAG: VacJ family lipoprotein [Hyphomonadaceae bacterium]|nr:VacJ family lipoprotein [Hyphomonadaceae bacterium]
MSNKVQGSAQAKKWLALATRALAPLVAATALCAPAYAQNRDYDPWERTNRKLFAVHEAVDKAALGPTAREYRRVTPTPVRSGVSNFLRNLRGPQIFANDLLQGEFKRAGATAARFTINSTLGVAGVFDPAAQMGIERHSEDFGQTLAVWGVPSGPYVFIPVLGPTSVRDGAGAIANFALDPFTWMDFRGDDEFMVFRTGMTALAARESVIEAVDNVRQSSIDPYVTIRSTYGLLRESSIRNGLDDVQDLPDFEDIPTYEDAPAAAPSSDPSAAPTEVTPAPTPMTELRLEPETARSN